MIHINTRVGKNLMSSPMVKNSIKNTFSNNKFYIRDYIRENSFVPYFPDSPNDKIPKKSPETRVLMSKGQAIPLVIVIKNVARRNKKVTPSLVEPVPDS